MSLHDRLLTRSLASLFGIVLLTVSFGFLADFRPDQIWMALPVLAGLGLTIGAIRLGFGALTASLLTLFCTVTLVGYVALTGGVESHYTIYLGLAAFAAWIWSGARGGIAATVVLTVALVVLGIQHPTPVLEQTSPRVDIALACGVSALWLWFVVTDLRSALQQRLESTAVVEQSAREALWDDQARDRFLAMVSHEFRTPLNVVLGYEEMLREEEDNPERVRDLKRIHAAGQHLLSLIDDLIDLSSNDDAELPLAVETVSLAPILEEVSVITKPLVELRGNTWRLAHSTDLPPVSADPRRTFQILLNLVSNAAKYTSDGEIALTAARVGDEVHVTVRDTGVGIARARLDELFTPFAQVQDSEDQRPGLGLGLALSQRWAHLMEGRIEVESDAGQGSTFRLCLPRA